MHRSESVQGFLRRFLEDLHRLNIPGRTRGILVAASGGPDSTALSHLLALVRDQEENRASWPTFWLGHIHHGMRGADADADAAFARGLAKTLGFHFLEVRVDVPALARARGLSPEAAARAARYQAFCRWAKEHPIDEIALAHTADDQVETILLRILRCAGLRGLSGMPEARPLSPGQKGEFPRIIRPLLGWRREELLFFLSDLGLPYREDLSNRDLSFIRNRIRHQLLPVLCKDFNPAINRTLLEIGRIAQVATRDLESIAQEALKRVSIRQTPDFLEIPGADLQDLPPTVSLFILQHVAAQVLRKGGGNIGHLPSLRKLERILFRLGGDRDRAGSLDLGGGLLVEVRRGNILMTKVKESESMDSIPPVSLPIPGSARWGDWEIQAELTVPVPSIRYPKSPGEDSRLREFVDRSTLLEPLQIRSRRPGDRFRPLGAPGTKKLKDLFREHRTLPQLRARIPLVVDSSGIVWVVGHQIADSHRLTSSTVEVVKLTARRLKETDEYPRFDVSDSSITFPESPA